MLGSAQIRAQVCRENPAPRCVAVLYRDSTRSALWNSQSLLFPKPILEARMLLRPLCKAHVHAADGFEHLC